MKRLPVAPPGFVRNSVMQLPVMDHEILGQAGGYLGLFLLSSDLGKHLSSWFGPSDEKIPGKYRTAEVFYFQGGEDGCVAAVCERGDRGSHWAWIPFSKETFTPHSIVAMSLHATPPYWPKMILDLSARLAVIEPDNKDHDHQQIQERLDRAGLLSPGFSPPSQDSVVRSINASLSGSKAPP